MGATGQLAASLNARRPFSFDFKQREQNFTYSALACAVMLGMCAAPLLAHPVSLSRGRVEIASEHIDVNIEAPGEDLLHLGLLTPGEGNTASVAAIKAAARTYATTQRDHLVLRDVTGHRLKGTVVSTDLQEMTTSADREVKLSTVWIETHLRYAPTPKNESSVVTFQFVGSDRAQALLTRLGVLANYKGEKKTSTFTLTNGGNVETIEPVASQNTGERNARNFDSRSWLGNERFKTMYAHADIEKDSMVLTVVIPAPTTETWDPIARHDIDLLTPVEQERVCQSWRTRFANAVKIEIDGKQVEPRIETVKLIRADETESSDRRAARTIGFHSARIAGVLRVPVASTSGEAKITWQLFNEAVLTARVLATIENSQMEYTVGVYAPLFKLQLKDAEKSP